MAVDFVPCRDRQLGEAAGLAIDHTGAEVRFIEEDLQAHRVVAWGW
jgi:tRNA nucleotidyltransferase (CCA-adding enzyme)